MKTENAMGLAEIYDPLVLGSSENAGGSVRNSEPLNSLKSRTQLEFK